MPSIFRSGASVLGIRKKKGDPRERRRLVRLPDKNVVLEIDGKRYSVEDWSADGFRASGFRGGHASGDMVRLTVAIKQKGKTHRFDIRGRIVRADVDAGEIAGQFNSMSTRGRKELAKIYRERLARYQAKNSVPA